MLHELFITHCTNATLIMNPFTQHGQIVCNSFQLSSIMTTDISVDVTTLLESNILGKNEAANSSMIPALAAAIWQKGEERDILQGKL